MRELKKQLLELIPTEELLLHRAATTPSHRCCDYRAVLGDRLPSLPRGRCLQNEIGARCVAPPRMRSRLSV